MSSDTRPTLGAVRSRPSERRFDELPGPGPAREAAVDRLRSVIARDVMRSLDSAVAAGWHPLDHGEVVAGYLAWIQNLAQEAVEDGHYDWRHAPGRGGDS